MKIIAKRFASLFIAVAFLFILLPVRADAAVTILSISKNDIKTGDDFTVTISGASTSNLSLHYDGTMVTLKSQGNAALDGNTLTINAKSASFAFTAKKSGSAGFVASSDQYEKSSVLVNIGEAAADTKKSDTSEKTDTAAADTTKKAASEKTASDKSSADDSASTDTTSDTNTSDKAKTDTASDSLASDTTADTADNTDTASFSSSDLSLKELLLDRRVIVIIGALAAVIIVLIIMLLWNHYSAYRDFDEEDEEDDEEEGSAVINEKSEVHSEKKPEAFDMDDTDQLYERLKEEEKLTMPKTPVVPEKKLHLEDLNNL